MIWKIVYWESKSRKSFTLRANTIKRRIQSMAGITRSDVSTRLIVAGDRAELAFSPELWADRYKKQTYLGKKIFF
jgi:hypothetical protein